METIVLICYYSLNVHVKETMLWTQAYTLKQKLWNLIYLETVFTLSIFPSYYLKTFLTYYFLTFSRQGKFKQGSSYHPTDWPETHHVTQAGLNVLHSNLPVSASGVLRLQALATLRHVWFWLLTLDGAGLEPRPLHVLGHYQLSYILALFLREYSLILFQVFNYR